MAKRKTIEELFKGRHFEREIIILCVRWYLRFKLSSRDLVEMMAERGLTVALGAALRSRVRETLEPVCHCSRLRLARRRDICEGPCQLNAVLAK